MNDLARPPQNTDPLLLPTRETPYILEDVLERIVDGCRDEIILDLGDSSLRFGVDIDTDTITGQFRPGAVRARKGYRSVRSATPWKKCVGKECG